MQQNTTFWPFLFYSVIQMVKCYDVYKKNNLFFVVFLCFQVQLFFKDIKLRDVKQ